MDFLLLPATLGWFGFPVRLVSSILDRVDEPCHNHVCWVDLILHCTSRVTLPSFPVTMMHPNHQVICWMVSVVRIACVTHYWCLAFRIHQQCIMMHPNPIEQFLKHPYVCFWDVLPVDDINNLWRGLCGSRWVCPCLYGDQALGGYPPLPPRDIGISC